MVPLADLSAGITRRLRLEHRVVGNGVAQNNRRRYGPLFQDLEQARIDVGRPGIPVDGIGHVKLSAADDLKVGPNGDRIALP